MGTCCHLKCQELCVMDVLGVCGLQGSEVMLDVVLQAQAFIQALYGLLGAAWVLRVPQQC